MLKKITRQQMEQWATLGLQQAINQHREELAQLESLAQDMNGKPKPAAADKPKRKISAKHKAALAQSMRRRWREAKKAGKTLNQTG